MKMRKILTSLLLSVMLLPTASVVQAQSEFPLLLIMQRPADISCAELKRRTDMRNMSDRDRAIYARNYGRYADGIETAKIACAETQVTKPLQGDFWLLANQPESIRCDTLKARTAAFPMSVKDAAFFAGLSAGQTAAIELALKNCAADSTTNTGEQSVVFSTLLQNPTLLQCEQLEKRLNILNMDAGERKRYAELDVPKIKLLQQALQDCDKNKITAEPTFLSYKTVRDNF